jgi:hypothetical protein
MTDPREQKAVEFVDGVGLFSAKGASKEDWIASQLKSVYDAAAEEPVPADMLALLDQLDDADDAEPTSGPEDVSD